MKNTILITGASSGIGREISIKLSILGYRCLLTGRKNIELEKTLKMMSGENHLIFSGDLNNVTFIDYISDQVNDLSGIIHAAGIIKLLPVKYINKEDFDKIMNTNFFAPFFLTQSLFKKKNFLNNSCIFFISSGFKHLSHIFILDIFPLKNLELESLCVGEYPI